MDIRDITVLTRNEKNSNLYDLTKVTFRYVNNDTIAFAEYKVPKYQEMRIDLICKTLYANLEYIDFLLQFNFISNPLNIKAGSLIKYIHADKIPPFYVNPSSSQNIQQKISFAGRVTQTDPSRQEYNDQPLALPPTIMPKPTQQVTVVGNTLKTGGLFKG
jgi:hypothetical protein